jgi:hypothetical protein
VGAALAVVLVGVGVAPARGVEEDLDLGAVVRWLSSPSWEGRGDASPRLDDLADSLRARLRPFGETGEQVFENAKGVERRNVYWSRQPETEPGRWIVLGAHYDHLGRGLPGDPHEGTIYPGADDNASGVAVAFGVVQRLTRMPASDRGVCVVFFAGEETGLEGSRAFLEEGPLPAGSVVAMVNLDTVGRLESGGLSVFGVDSSPVWTSTLQGIDSAYGLPLKLIDRSSGASDDATFAAAGIPSLHFFTGAHADYHRPSDTPDKIDVAGLDELADFVTDLVDYVAAGDFEIRFVPQGAAGVAADPQRATEGRRRVSFGTIPDFQFAGPGVRITGVLPGSPAQKAGVQKGDVIVSFGGEAVEDLTDYSEAMKLYAPGDEVTVGLHRGKEPLEVRVTLVERK